MSTVDTAIALISLADAKEYLKITTTSEDSIISSLINSISVAANSFTGRHLLEKSHTEYYNGSGSDELILNHYPVTAVSSLYDDVNRDFDSSSQIDVSSDVMIETDTGAIRLWNTESAFNVGKANVKITYTAGYALASVPADLQMAIKRWVAIQYFKYSNRRHETQSETTHETTVTYFNEEIPKDVEHVLRRYKSGGNSPHFAFR